MQNPPTASELAAIPRLYSTQGIPLPDKIVHIHFFLAGFHWYAVEFDGRDSFRGFVVVHGDPAGVEWGYFSLSELRGIRHDSLEVGRAVFWKPIPAKNIGLFGDFDETA